VQHAPANTNAPGCIPNILLQQNHYIQTRKQKERKKQKE